MSKYIVCDISLTKKLQLPENMLILTMETNISHKIKKIIINSVNDNFLLKKLFLLVRMRIEPTTKIVIIDIIL